ncbi:protein kinase [Actinoplanes sp. NPDC051859]|uniref:serine/threonine-protein kinase n=1 Tax=Actinoplanes sp. NPDC051859 TaxID=3363909 RepID=UPI003799C3BB
MPSHPPVPESAGGSVLVAGRYRLVEQIGAGGMGVVWRGQDELLRRQVAVKELRHGWGSSDQTVAVERERSLREARAAAALHHPNIVSVFDIVEHDGRPWIVMELVAGRSLKELIAAEGPLPAARVVEVGLQLLSALTAAHGAGITHRDVKPANVLVSPDGRVRLTDFGLATTPDSETLTESGMVLGTPGYLAPEQAKGLPPGPPADIFGFGATLYYAVEGLGPFQRDAYLPMLMAYAKHDVRQPQRAGALAPALMRLLTADPAQRPTAEQARDLLLGKTVRRPVLTRRRLLVAGAVVSAASVAGAVGVWSRTEKSSGVRRPVGVGAAAWRRDNIRSAFAAGTALFGGDADKVWTIDPATGRDGWTLRATKSPSVSDVGDGRLLVTEFAGPAGYRILDAATGRQRAESPRGVVGVVPGLVLAEEQEQKLTGVDPLTGKDLWTAANRFSPGGFHSAEGIFCYFGDQVLYGLDRSTGKPRWTTRLAKSGRVAVPQHSPSALRPSSALWGAGRLVHAAVAEGRKFTLHCVDVTTGKRMWAVELLDVATDEDEAAVEVLQVDTVGGLSVATIRDGRVSPTYSGLVAVADGAIRWRRPLLNPNVVVTDGGRLFAASYDSVLHELDPTTGQTVWSTATSGAADLFAAADTVVAQIGWSLIGYPLVKI